MNNLTKRLLAMLLTAVMTLSLLPGAALAEEQESSAVEFKTRETSSGLVIRGFQGTFPDGLLEIPSEIGGKKVYCIEKEAFRGTEGLRRVLIPATVNEIGAGAFRDCKDLLNAEFLGEAPKNFGKKVFDGCAKDFAIWHRGGAADVVKYKDMVGYDADGFIDSKYNRPDRFLRQGRHLRRREPHLHR